MSKKKTVYQSTDFGIAGIYFEREIAQKKIDQLTKENEVLRKTLVRVSNEKDRIIDKQNIDYLSFASQLRHEICQEIKIEMTSIEPNCSIEDMNSNLYEFTGREIYTILDKIEKGDI